jgi:hypothetical protein
MLMTEVYSSHQVLQTACALVQTACSSPNVYFLLLGLTISSTKSEAVLFSQNHLRPIDGELRLDIIRKMCLQRLNFLKAIAGIW